MTKATTVHNFVDLLMDGRYNANAIPYIVKSHSAIWHQIEQCDVLFIDEYSMISERTLGQIEMACSVKDKNKYFGWMQIVSVRFTSFPRYQTNIWKILVITYLGVTFSEIVSNIQCI